MAELTETKDETEIRERVRERYAAAATAGGGCRCCAPDLSNFDRQGNDVFGQALYADEAEGAPRNAEFLKGYVEDIPLPDNSVDVVISNCVINLSADKREVLAETARVLKPGGRFAVSDVIADPDMDDATPTSRSRTPTACTSTRARRSCARASRKDWAIAPIRLESPRA